MVDDKSFSGAFDQIALGGVSGDDVADRVRNAAFERESNPSEWMAQRLSAFALAALAVGADFVFQQLADIGQDCARDHGIGVNGQGPSHEIAHGPGAIASDVYDAALVFHKGDGTIRD